MQTPETLVIIAGNGIYPQLVTEAARSANVSKVFAVAFENETDSHLAQLVDEICWLRVGQLNRMLSTLRKWGAKNAIMAGQIAPRNLFELRPDWRALLLLARLRQRNAESIFSAIANELEQIGVTLLPATTFVEDLLAPNGHICGAQLSRREKHDLEFGWSIAKQIAALNIGQTVVLKDGAVLAVEAFEGTNAAIKRGGGLARSGAVVIKVAKPNQDMRFDLPVVGLDTIGVCAEAKIRVLAVESGKTLLLKKQAMCKAAEAAGISLTGYARKD